MKRKLSITNYVVLLGATAFFVFPLFAATEFALRANGATTHNLSNFKWAIQQDGFKTNL
jgi:hypothetical protein